MIRYGVRPDVRTSVLNAANGVCFYCGGVATDADHILAASRGGLDHPENLIASCQPCNGRKSSKRLPDALFAAALEVAKVRAVLIMALIPDAPIVPRCAPDDVRKSVMLPDSLLAEMSEFRHGERIGTEAEALRRLIQAGLRAEKRKDKP